MENVSERIVNHHLSYKVGAHIGFVVGVWIFSTGLFTILWLRSRVIWSSYPLYVGVVLVAALLLYLVISRIGVSRVPAEEF